MKFPADFPILGRELTGVSGKQSEIIYFTPYFAYPSTITAYFEVIAKNSGSSDYTVSLQMSSSYLLTSDSTEKSVTIPANTSEYRRFRSTSFTPSTTNHWKGISIGNTAVSLAAARIHAVVDTGSQPLYRYCPMINLGHYELYDYSDTSNHLLAYPKYYKHIRAGQRYKPSLVQGRCTFSNENQSYISFPEVGQYHSVGTPIGDYFNWPNTNETIKHNVDVDWEGHWSSGFNDQWFWHPYVRQGTSMRGGTLYNLSVHPITVAGESGDGAIRSEITNYSYRSVYGGTATSGQADQAQGQSFTVGGTAITLGAISFFVEKTGDPTDNLVAKVYDGLTGSLLTNGTSELLNCSIIDSMSDSVQLYNDTLITLYWATPPSLSANTKYYVRLERTGSRDGANYVDLLAASSNQYSGGNDIIRDNNSWSEGSGDNYFIVCPGGNKGMRHIEIMHEIIPHNQTGTGLMGFPLLYDPDEWEGFDEVAAFYEHHGSASTSRSKLQRYKSLYDVSDTTTNKPIYGSGGLDEGQAQSFYTPNDGNQYVLQYIDLYVSVTGSPTDNLQWNLTTSAFSPAQLGGGSIAAGNLVNNAVNRIYMTSPYTMSANTKYFVNIIRSGSRDTSNYVSVKVSGSSQVASVGYTTLNNASGGSEQVEDMYLEVFGTIDVEKTDITGPQYWGRSYVDESYEDGTLTTKGVMGGTAESGQTMQRLGQSFQVSEAFTCYGFEVEIRPSTTSMNNYCVVQLVSTLGGAYLGSPWYPVWVDDFSTSSWKWITQYFTGGVALSASTTYYLEMSMYADSRDATNYVIWACDSSGTYSNGVGWQKDNGSWSELTGYDFNFRILRSLPLPSVAEEIDSYVVAA